MILGIGVDIARVSRFKKWVENPSMIERFFNPKECKSFKSVQKSCEHYAARFAVKEAFGKALGTGLLGFDLKDVYVLNKESGEPYLVLENKALEILKKRCNNPQVHISLSHESDSAIAFVVIEG